MVGDSRIRDFNGKPEPYSHLYPTTYIGRSGAGIQSIETETIEYIGRISRQDIIIIYICAGICEITFKEYYAGGTELSLHSRQNVVENIINFKAKIRRYHPRSIVGISTIPIISFKLAQAYYKSSLQLSVPKYTEEQLQVMQKNLSDLLPDINTTLAHQNRFL